jgi:hypothetical protein
MDARWYGTCSCALHATDHVVPIQTPGYRPMTLDEAMAGLKAELENRLDHRIASLATREDLERAIAPLATREFVREEIQRAIAPLATREFVREAIRTELAAHARTIEEMFRRYFGALDDKFKHIPGDVKTLRSDLEEHAGDAAIHLPRREP